MEYKLQQLHVDLTGIMQIEFKLRSEGAMEYARDIMTRNVEIVHESTKLNVAAKRMKDKNIGFLVVGNGAIPIGCVTDRDLVISGMAKGFDPCEHSVSEVMTHNILSCESSTKVDKVIDLMKEHKVYRVLVTDANKKPVGVVTLGDLASRTKEEVPIHRALREISKVSS